MRVHFTGGIERTYAPLWRAARARTGFTRGRAAGPSREHVMSMGGIAVRRFMSGYPRVSAPS